jgi:segregation and condensation protein A
MAYNVKIEVFEGPLDLLLHLISKAKVEIEQVSITEITKQYLDYLYQMKQFDIDVASEFLVMASTLIYIKSRKLVPRNDEDFDIEEEDPEKVLIERLKAYSLFKQAAGMLSTKESAINDIYYKLPEELFFGNVQTTIDGDLDGIMRVFQEVLLRARKQPEKMTPHRVKRDKKTLGARIEEIKLFFEKSNHCAFYDLFEGSYDKPDIVITLLAVLELLSEGFIVARQDSTFGEIEISRRAV